MVVTVVDYQPPHSDNVTPRQYQLAKGGNHCAEFGTSQ